ncbi:MAG: M48 family metallopeptidase [Anaerolineales bacterium]|nr:M48 family metallopeptidase [Anaerolineales bacterium]
MKQIELNGQLITYTVRESRRAQRARLQISPHKGLELIVPAGLVSEQEHETMLRQKTDWILANLRQRPAFLTGDTLSFLGDPHTLELIATPNGKRTTVARQGQTLRIRLKANLAAAERQDTITRALQNWYKNQARHYLPQRVSEIATQHGFNGVGEVTIRGQRTRWGSCSSRGNLSLNWRLMMVLPSAIDYIIIHELCHLLEMNHSPRFWALVAQYCPDYQQWRRYLKNPQLVDSRL